VPLTLQCLSLQYNVYNTQDCEEQVVRSIQLRASTAKPQDYVSLVDMGLIWRLATPTHEDREARKRNGSEYYWSDYLHKICSIILSRHAHTRLIILVNDKYDLLFSIKDDQHDRRAAMHPHIPNVFPKPTDPFSGAAEFNKLIVNPGNKEQMKTQIDRLRTGVIYCEGETTGNLSTGVESEDYVFKHAESD
jgi:hypothetical protein